MNELAVGTSCSQAVWARALQSPRSVRALVSVTLAATVAVTAVHHLTQQAQAQTLQTCSDVHAYCMQLCQKSATAPPPEWTCEVNRCYGLKECLVTGHYKIGTQYGHPKSTRESYGPYDKK